MGNKMTCEDESLKAKKNRQDHIHGLVVEKYAEIAGGNAGSIGNRPPGGLGACGNTAVLAGFAFNLI
ncbi:MAG TPA: hypothetical protein VMW42_04295 [Desulfatiglandales bacterium]|nr:hypothetical protein [Desulfatiglandales bacterium]